LKRKLWLLNFALAAAIAAGGWQLRNEARELQKRKDGVVGKKVPVPPPPPAPPPAPSQAVTASSYLEIAQKMLWAKDRSSVVVPDPPKPKESPKPLPALPAVHGVMNIGDGPIVMMSDGRGGRQRGTRPGDKIGEFKLVSVNSEELVLSWEDRTVTKKIDELIDRAGDAGPAPGPAGTAVSSPSPSNPAPQVVGKAEPGVKLTDGVSSCQTNDPSPPGTVVNGMRKVVRRTPFGDACSWEAVK
jgi:hypothetical protein